MRYLKLSLAIVFCLIPGLVSAQYKDGRSSYQDLYDSDVISAMKSHVSYLSSRSLEGRKAGSDGERLAADYIGRYFDGYGVDRLSAEEGDLFGISREGGDTLTSRNVIGFVQGNDPKLRDRYVVVGARLDNIGKMAMTVDGQSVDKVFAGANGNASGLAVMLELARMVKMNAHMFRRSVLFVAFGASCETFAGAWYFLNRSFGDADRIDTMVNLDMLGTGDKFYAYTSSNMDMNAIVSKLSGQLMPVHPDLVSFEPYPSDHRAFYAKNIPSVFFTRGKYREHNTERDTEDILDYVMMERELEYIYNFTQELANSSQDFLFDSSEDRLDKEEFDDVVAYHDCDQRPMFLNSPEPAKFMEKWVYQYLKYPKNAVKNGIQGRVMVDFIVDKSGKVTNVRVVRGVDPELDAEAVRVISASPKWRPGKLKGQKVRTSVTVAVDFKLEKKSSKPSFGFKKHYY